MADRAQRIERNGFRRECRPLDGALLSEVLNPLLGMCGSKPGNCLGISWIECNGLFKTCARGDVAGSRQLPEMPVALQEVLVAGETRMRTAGALHVDFDLEMAGDD